MAPTILLALAALAAPALGAGGTDVYRNNVVIVLDASGSMAEPMGGSRFKKMNAAKSALKEVLKHVAETTNIGLLVFSSRNVRVEWVYPLSPKDDARLMRAIDLPMPGGSTPLGAYIKKGADRLLEERAAQFGYGTYRLLIVTDGEAQDQNLVERYTPEVIARGITVDVIGVAMKKAHTLATKVNSYRSADDPESLERAVAEVFAEMSGTDTDSADDDAFEILAGLPDGLAEKMLGALATSGNEPIGRRTATRGSQRPQPSATHKQVTKPRPKPPRHVRPPRRHRVNNDAAPLVAGVFALVLGVCAVVAGYYARKAGAIAKLIGDLPTTPIGRIKPGLVEVKGRLRKLTQELESPYAQKSCLYYRFKVIETGKKHSSIRIDDRRSAQCLVKDETGSCELNLARAEVVADAQRSGQTSGFFNTVEPALEQALRQTYGRTTKGLIFDKNLRYEETVLVEGDLVYILGWAQRAKDGKVRITKRGGTFIVSDKSEQKLLSRYGMRAALLYVGSVASVVMAIGILVLAF
jgi:uncharacterized protein YegL